MVKKIAGLCFAIAFLMALVLFANVGREYIGYFNARIIFISAGALGIILNLFSFQNSNHPPIFSLFYWTGSLIFFAGLVLNIFHLPYSNIAILIGAIVVAGSFFLPQFKEKDNSNLLDEDF